MQEIIRDGVTQLNKLPPSSNLWLRRVCVLAARSGRKAVHVCCQPSSRTVTSPSPPSSGWVWAELRTGCTHTCVHTHVYSAVACPTVLCNGTKAVRQPCGPHWCGPRQDLLLSKAHAGRERRRERGRISHPTSCNRCPCTSGPLPRLPLLLSFTPAPESTGQVPGERAG